MDIQVSESMSAVTFAEGQECFGVYPKDRIVFNRAVSDWCLRNAAHCIDRQVMEEALQWDAIAARVMSFECATLASPELEKQLLHIGRWQNATATAISERTQSNRWLHVLTEVRPDGGHSVMLRRWIQQDPQDNRHSVAVLAQTVPVPEPLVEAVQVRNGEIFRMDPQDTLLNRAARLREIVRDHADVVVLHTHPWDVIATVALSLPGGPPVLLVNHAAHIFWVGASIADVILDCRHSPQEDEWTAVYRGSNRIMHLPIPLIEPAQNENISGKAQVQRESVRKALNVPHDALVMLTVGIDNKYTPFQGVDFLQAAGAVLQVQANAYLIVVGPKFDAKWKALGEAVGGRLVMIEKQPDTSMSTYFEAADIYLEGFPFGSTTSLFEAGLHGIACVLAPKLCPPPFTTDGIALQMLSQPNDMTDYVAGILALLNDPIERLRRGRLLADSIRSHHCGTGWGRYLEEVQNKIPPVHAVHVLNDVVEQVPELLSAYWTAFSYAIHEDPLVCAFRQAAEQGLRPVIDMKLFGQIKRSGKRGRGRYYPSLMTLIGTTSRQSFVSLVKPVYTLIKSICRSATNMTERVKIVCQSGK